MFCGQINYRICCWATDNSRVESVIEMDLIKNMMFLMHCTI